MSANSKCKRQAVGPPDHSHLEDLLDEALAESFPASDPIAVDFDSPEDRVAKERRE